MVKRAKPASTHPLVGVHAERQTSNALFCQQLLVITLSAADCAFVSRHISQVSSTSGLSSSPRGLTKTMLPMGMTETFDFSSYGGPACGHRSLRGTVRGDLPRRRPVCTGTTSAGRSASLPDNRDADPRPNALDPESCKSLESLSRTSAPENSPSRNHPSSSSLLQHRLSLRAALPFMEVEGHEHK